MTLLLDLGTTLYLGYFAVLLLRNRAIFTTLPDALVAIAWAFSNVWVLSRLWVHQ